MKLKPVTGTAHELLGYTFWCPGCDHSHVFWTAGNLVWSFDGNLEQPTFSPSLLNTCDPHPDPKQRRCHLFLQAGKIVYCADCAHDLAGRTVPLEDHWDDEGTPR